MVDAQVKMKAPVTLRHSKSFLPEISPLSNKRRKISKPSLKKNSLQTEPGSDKPAQILSKEEIARFRNTVKQNICVEMLKEGYHRSFSELFALLRSEQDRRAAAEPGSALSLQTPLEVQQDKLETIRLHLCKAEQAERTGAWTLVCEQRLVLGVYFSAPEDLLLSLHFLHSCADREQGGCSRPATEARACLAELYLKQKDLEQARQQAEMCLKLAEDGGWMDSAGQPLRLRARQLLGKIYTQLADAPLAASDHKQALTLLHKGYSVAAQSENKQIEGEAAYCLGLAYQCTGDHGTAKKFFNTCMQIFGTLQDADGLGKAYKAMAKSLESQGNIDETIRCLEELADISRSNGLQYNLVDACLCLGNIYCNMDQYRKACESFLQGYEVACHIGDVPLLQRAQVDSSSSFLSAFLNPPVACFPGFHAFTVYPNIRNSRFLLELFTTEAVKESPDVCSVLCQVLLANARAQFMIAKYSADIRAATPVALQRLLAWKESRRHQELSRDSADPTAPVWY